MARSDEPTDASTASESVPLGGGGTQRAAILDRPGHQVWLQREDRGPLRTFKWRGALAHCEALRREGARGVVAASTGNFAAAVAWSADRCGLPARVVVPETTSTAKLATLAELGADVVRHGAALGEAASHAQQLAAEAGLSYFEDGGSEWQIEGVSELGVELAAAAPDVVVVPVACGALAAGIVLGLRRAGSQAAVIGVQTRPCSRLAARFHGLPEPPSHPAWTIADGLADDRLVDPAFSTCLEELADVIVVEDDAIRSALRTMNERVGLLVEGAGAASLAALHAAPDRVGKGKVVLVVSGANIAPSLAAEILGSPVTGEL